jgi:hypothetical protein
LLPLGISKFFAFLRSWAFSIAVLPSLGILELIFVAWTGPHCFFSFHTKEGMGMSGLSDIVPSLLFFATSSSSSLSASNYWRRLFPIFSSASLSTKALAAGTC